MFQYESNISFNLNEGCLNFNTFKSIEITEFTNEAMLAFKKDIDICIKFKQPIIPIYINTYGGCVENLLSMIDLINSTRDNYNVQFATICLGKCYSAGAYLLPLGNKGLRYASENSMLMLHDPLFWVSGSLEEVKNYTNNCERLAEYLYEILDKNTSNKKGYFKNIIKKQAKDYFMNATEAKKHGMIDHIKIPKFNVEYNVSVIMDNN